MPSWSNHLHVVYASNDCSSTPSKFKGLLTLPNEPHEMCSDVGDSFSVSAAYCNVTSRPPRFSGNMHISSTCATTGTSWDMLTDPNALECAPAPAGYGGSWVVGCADVGWLPNNSAVLMQVDFNGTSVCAGEHGVRWRLHPIAMTAGTTAACTPTPHGHSISFAYCAMGGSMGDDHPEYRGLFHANSTDCSSAAEEFVHRADAHMNSTSSTCIESSDGDSHIYACYPPMGDPSASPHPEASPSPSPEPDACQCFANDPTYIYYCESGTFTGPSACTAEQGCHWGPRERADCLAMLTQPSPSPNGSPPSHNLFWTVYNAPNCTGGVSYSSSAHVVESADAVSSEYCTPAESGVWVNQVWCDVASSTPAYKAHAFTDDNCTIPATPASREYNADGTACTNEYVVYSCTSVGAVPSPQPSPLPSPLPSPDIGENGPPPSTPLPSSPPPSEPPTTPPPPSAPPFPPLSFKADIAVSLTSAATAGKSAAEVAAAILNATGAASDSLVVISKRSTLGVSLPADADPHSHLSAVESAACAGKPAGCAVSIATGGRRMQDVRGSGSRRLQSTQVTFVVEVPVGAGESLDDNATAAAALTSALTSSLTTALGAPVTVATPIATSTSVTISVVIEGSADSAQAATASSLGATAVTTALATSLGVDASTLSVAEPQVLFPPRPPPSTPPPSPPSPPQPQSPPAPPPPPPSIVRVSFTASGDVSDFTPERKTAILAALATAAGLGSVPLGANLTVTAASVLVEAALPVASAAESAAAVSSLSAAMATPSAASAMFASAGVTALTVETAVTVAAVAPGFIPIQSPSSCGMSTSGVCEYCMHGTYKAVYSPWDYRCNNCEPCAVGSSRFACGGDTAGYCLACAKGFYKDATAYWDTQCTPCPSCTAGAYRVGCGADSVGMCVGCPTGKYKDGPYEWDSRCSSCEHCAAGAYRYGCTGSSAGTCESCPSGQFKAAGPPSWWEQPCSHCLPCPAGYQLEGCAAGSPGTCVQCAHGKFKPEQGAWDTLCQPLEACPPGEVRLGAFAYFGGTCARCESGFYKVDTAAWNTTCTACEACGPGTYRTFCGDASAGRCSDCPHGMNKPATHPGACVACEQCSPGYVLN